MMFVNGGESLPFPKIAASPTCELSLRPETFDSGLSSIDFHKRMDNMSAQLTAFGIAFPRKSVAHCPKP